VRESDVVVRWGGEEFLVLLRQTNRGETIAVAERMRRRFSDQPFELPGGERCAITCSIGCCAYPLGDPEDFDWDQVVNLADWALRRAKTAGRNRVMGIDLGQRRVDLEARRQILRDPESACLAGNLALLKPGDG
jgi:diguanylate cyclase (GGDEF)-like protein